MNAKGTLVYPMMPNSERIILENVTITVIINQEFIFILLCENISFIITPTIKKSVTYLPRL